MAQLASAPYQARDFSHLSGLQGLSDHQIAIHLGLYQGYVTNTNRLNDTLRELVSDGKAGSPEYAELTRRLGFEYSGMILHEYYFDNLSASGAPEPPVGSRIRAQLDEAFGSYAQWAADFQNVGKMRGVGWAVLFQDPSNGRLSNHWISLHQDGVPVGFQPIVVMDVWEHAFLIDYLPAERPKYIDAFFANLNWTAIGSRLIADDDRP